LDQAFSRRKRTPQARQNLSAGWARFPHSWQ
jgi:hypothetical protein